MDRLELEVDAGISFRVESFVVQDYLSSVFDVTVFAGCDDDTVDLDAIAGKPATFTVRAPERPVRIWKGVCSLASLTAAHQGLPGTFKGAYAIRIAPRLWLTTMRRENRIFQDKSIPDIVKKVLSDWKITPKTKLQRTYKSLEYCVQYDETDFDFISRLLERASISYWHEEGELVLADQPELGEVRGSPLRHFDLSPHDLHDEDWVSDAHVRHEVRPGAFAIRDYEFRRATKDKLVGTATPAPAPEATYEQYHYAHGASVVVPGDPAGEIMPVADKLLARHEQKTLTELAERRLLAARRAKIEVSYRSNAIDLAPGKVFTVSQHVHPDLAPSNKFLITETRLQGDARQGDWLLTGVAALAGDKNPYAPEVRTPRPVIRGVQSAVVVGPKGDEVHTDEWGRVRVQFPWDRDHKRDEQSSCWIRVSQAWAGKTYGTILIPRVGHEVLVSFFEGNPDMPVVVGRVYNGKNSVPYKLNENKTVSTLKSDSSPGDNGYNEILIEDKADVQYVYVQAQRDLQRLVKNDESERTGSHRHIYVGEDRRRIVRDEDVTLVGKKYQLQMIEEPEPEDRDMHILPAKMPKVKPEPVKMEMIYEKLLATSGKATMLMKKDTITFDAKGHIYIHSTGGDVVFETPAKVIKINC